MSKLGLVQTIIQNINRGIVKVLKDVAIVVAVSVVGMLLVITSYLIPNDNENIKLNVARGSDIMLSQGPWYVYAGDYTAAVLDNVTDAIFLGGSSIQTGICSRRSCLCATFKI